MHGLFGIGDFDDSGPVPWFKFRMVEISKIRAIRKKRQLSFPALAMAARYCYRRHIPIKGVWELVAFIVPAAKAAGRDRVSPLGVEVREAVANERSREDPSPDVGSPAAAGAGRLPPRTAGPVAAGARVNKEVNQIIDYAISQGWRVTRTKNDHFKFWGPAGQLVVSSGTPSDRRAVTAIRTRLRREGLMFPADQHRKKKK